MARAEKTKNKKISILNWMGTLLVCSIPGLNLVALILFIIFAKNPSKRSFAVACIVLTLVLAALVCAAFIIFPQQLTQLAADLRGGDAAVLVMPQG
jgi:uncharacterized membrane protein YqjE